MNDQISRRSMLFSIASSAIPAFTKIDLKKNSNLLQQTASPSVKSQDRFSPINPGDVALEGFLGERCRKNERARLLAKNEDEMLQGFQKRPGKQAWIGEHAGKWLHAATLAWVYTKDPYLRSKLDRVAAELIAAQKDDGYLGTYSDNAHFGMGNNEQWDVWVHKYNLIGLITYHIYTGDKNALEASRKVGELLVRTFWQPEQGDRKLDLNQRSTHMGMASGSVLEPVVLLYKITGDEKYLQFARFIVDNWEQSTGPKLISSLTEKRSVKLTANAKAYEMMSCLVGLCELYRVTGEQRYILPVINAWKDITANQLLITGSGSSGEHWTEPRRFPSEAANNIAETCVTVTWIQLNQQLLRLTGEARYAEELERTFYNHLAAAQHPDGSSWAYFTALDGRKPYQTEQNCCTSSGPRGWAMLPSFVYMLSEDGVVVNFFTPGIATLKIDGEFVTIKQQTEYPANGKIVLTVTVPKPMKFSLRVRVPSWSNLDGMKAKPGEYWLLRQIWSRTQTITLDFLIPSRIILGEGSAAGKVAIVRGPQVLAFDESYNPDGPAPESVALPGMQLQLKPSVTYRDPDGNAVYETTGKTLQPAGSLKAGDSLTIRLVPFSSAGANGRQFTVWLNQAAGRASSESQQ
jgi:DUF1680 family protein